MLKLVTVPAVSPEENIKSRLNVWTTSYPVINKIDAKTVSKISNELLFQSQIFPIYYGAIKINEYTTFGNFFNNYLEPALQNTYSKLERNAINYFGENPFVDTFYSALGLYMKSPEFKRILFNTLRKLPKASKQFKYSMEYDYYVVNNGLGKPSKFNFSKCIKKQVKCLLKEYNIMSNNVRGDTQKLGHYDEIIIPPSIIRLNKRSTVDLIVTDNDEFVRLITLTPNEIFYIVFHALITSIKQKTLNKLDVECAETIFDGALNIYNAMAIDHSNFFTRNAQSLIDYLKKYDSKIDGIAEKIMGGEFEYMVKLTSSLFDNIGNISQDNVSKGMPMVLSDVTTDIYGIKQMIEAMCRPSSNKLADISIGLEELDKTFEEFIHKREEISTNINNLMSGFYRDYVTLGMKDSDLMYHIEKHLCDHSKYELKNLDFKNKSTDLSTIFQNESFAKYLCSDEVIGKYTSHHTDMIHDVDTLLNKISIEYNNLYLATCDIMKIITDWRQKIIDKVHLYHNYTITDSVKDEFSSNHNGTSINVFDMDFVLSLMKN